MPICFSLNQDEKAKFFLQIKKSKDLDKGPVCFLSVLFVWTSLWLRKGMSHIVWYTHAVLAKSLLNSAINAVAGSGKLYCTPCRVCQWDRPLLPGACGYWSSHHSTWKHGGQSTDMLVPISLFLLLLIFAAVYFSLEIASRSDLAWSKPATSSSCMLPCLPLTHCNCKFFLFPFFPLSVGVSKDWYFNVWNVIVCMHVRKMLMYTFKL